MMDSGESPRLLTLHRYYIWANRMRTHFDEILAKGFPTGVARIESLLYMSYWYGGLYVVIEGWRDLKLVDPVIDNLLQSSLVELLRKYRNGTFHFQRQYDDQRFLDFMQEGNGSVEWVRKLNEEIGRYFLNALGQDRCHGG